MSIEAYTPLAASSSNTEQRLFAQLAAPTATPHAQARRVLLSVMTVPGGSSGRADDSNGVAKRSVRAWNIPEATASPAPIGFTMAKGRVGGSDSVHILPLFSFCG